MDRADLGSRVKDQLGQLLGGEPAGHRVTLAPAPGRVLQRLPRLREVAGERPGQDGPAESGAEQAERSARAKRVDRVAYALGGVVHVLQDAVAQDGVVARAVHHLEQPQDVPLHTADPVGDTGLGRAAFQREQGVGAGVDDGDPVAEPGDGHREVAGAATGVQHVQGVPADRLDPAVEGVLEDLPDHGGTEGGSGAQLVRHGS